MLQGERERKSVYVSQFVYKTYLLIYHRAARYTHTSAESARPIPRLQPSVCASTIARILEQFSPCIGTRADDNRRPENLASRTDDARWYIHIYIYIYIYIYIHMYTYICMYIYMYVYTYVHGCVYKFVYFNIYIYTYICMYIHMYMYVYTNSPT